MVVFPPCKINLGIQVLSRRDDGFHSIETCFYPVPRTDILEIVPAATFSFNSTGIPIPGPLDSNLCVRAYDALRKDFNIPPVQIHLHKMIPMGSGLGGGSSNGTWSLRLLNDLFQLDLPGNTLLKYASNLGSDCAFFLHDTPQLGTDRGQNLTPVKVSLKGKYLAIIQPEVHISTKEAYAGVVPQVPEESVKEIVEREDVRAWKGKLLNQFEKHIIDLFPVIGSLRDELYQAGALYASMSGSGSSVYGIFDAEVNLRDKLGKYNLWSGWLTV